MKDRIWKRESRVATTQKMEWGGLVMAFWQESDAVRLWAADFSCQIPRFNNQIALSSDHGFLRAGVHVSRTEDRSRASGTFGESSWIVFLRTRVVSNSNFLFHMLTQRQHVSISSVGRQNDWSTGRLLDIMCKWKTETCKITTAEKELSSQKADLHVYLRTQVSLMMEDTSAPAAIFQRQ